MTRCVLNASRRCEGHAYFEHTAAGIPTNFLPCAPLRKTRGLLLCIIHAFDFRAKRTSVAEYPRMSDHAFKNERQIERQVHINITTGPAQCTTPQPWPQKTQLTCWRRSGRAARRSICSSTVAEPPPLCTSPTRQHRTQQLPPCWTQMSPPQRKPLEARWVFWYDSYAVALSARQPRLQEIGGIETAACRDGVHDAGMVGPQKQQHVVQESTITTTRRRKASS